MADSSNQQPGTFVPGNYRRYLALLASMFCIAAVSWRTDHPVRTHALWRNNLPPSLGTAPPGVVGVWRGYLFDTEIPARKCPDRPLLLPLPASSAWSLLASPSSRAGGVTGSEQMIGISHS